MRGEQRLTISRPPVTALLHDESASSCHQKTRWCQLKASSRIVFTKCYSMVGVAFIAAVLMFAFTGCDDDPPDDPPTTPTPPSNNNQGSNNNNQGNDNQGNNNNNQGNNNNQQQCTGVFAENCRNALDNNYLEEHESYDLSQTPDDTERVHDMSRDYDRNVNSEFDHQAYNAALGDPDAGAPNRDDTMMALCAGLTGCTATNLPEIRQYLYDEGITSLTPEQNAQRGTDTATVGHHIAFLDRIDEIYGCQGYCPPPVTERAPVSQTYNNVPPPGNNNPPTCVGGYRVMTAYVSGTDRGCRPITCPFGREANGWCSQPENSDPPIIYVAGSLEVDEDDGAAWFRVDLSHPIPQPVSVTAYTRSGSASSAQGDFTAVNRRVTIRPGSTIALVSVTILDDTRDEPDETFTLHISAPSSNAELSAATLSAEATIVDNDDPAVPGAPQNLVLVCAVSNSGFTLTASWEQASSGPPASGYETSFSSSDPGDVWNPTQEFYNNRIRVRGNPVINNNDGDRDGLPDGPTEAEVQVSGPGEYWVRVVPTWQGGGTPAAASTQCLPTVSLDDTALTVVEGSSVTITASLDRAPGSIASVGLNASGATASPGNCGVLPDADFAVDSDRFTFTSYRHHRVHHVHRLRRHRHHRRNRDPGAHHHRHLRPATRDAHHCSNLHHRRRQHTTAPELRLCPTPIRFGLPGTTQGLCWSRFLWI